MVETSYTRYLSSKISVDDRALNKEVLERLAVELRGLPSSPLQVLEIGAGLGTMVARLLDRGLLRQAVYTLLDVDRQLLSDSALWLTDWARRAGHRATSTPDGLRILGAAGLDVEVCFREAELADYLAAPHPQAVDLLVANAFLDLVEVPRILPPLFARLAPGGLWWFSINFDGETIFQPELINDDRFMQLYHRGMDERVRYGRPAGESRCGRHLFGQLQAAGGNLLAAGASDWVVYANPTGYAEDEAYFLHCILNTVEEGLQLRSEIDAAELADWMGQRRAQLARGELVYIAHQLDFVGKL